MDMPITFNPAAAPDGWDSPAVIVALAGAIANFLVILVAIGVPFWQAFREDQRLAKARVHAKALVVEAVQDAHNLGRAIIEDASKQKLFRANVSRWKTNINHALNKLDALVTRADVLSDEMTKIYWAKQTLHYIADGPAPVNANTVSDAPGGNAQWVRTAKKMLDAMQAHLLVLDRSV